MSRSPNVSKANQLRTELIEAMRQGTRSISARYVYVRNPGSWNDPGALVDILGLSREQLSERTHSVIDLLEDTPKDVPAHEDWIDLKWKLTAYFEIQDIFDSPIYSGKDVLNLFYCWYFYFESRHILIESVLCGLQGFYAASNSMLRLFLEFNILQLYYYRVSGETTSYASLEEYFKTGSHPSWNTTVKNCVPDDAFCRPIKKLLDLQLKGLSKSAAHAYHPDFSPRQYSYSATQISLEGIYFWYSLLIVLQPILWGYYVNFPMLFQPRDKIKKFGFNAPIGIFIDAQCAMAVKKSLQKDEYEEFFAYSAASPQVKSLIQSYDGRPDLSEEQIKSSWNFETLGEFKDIFPHGYSTMMAHCRVMREAMALRNPVFEPIPEDIFDAFHSHTYSTWKKAYKLV